VILDASLIIAGYPFVARRYGRAPLCDVFAVSACFARAAELAERPADEPAAVFFALASRRQAFPFASKLMACLVARSQATANGFTLGATAEELDALSNAVLYYRADWPTVRAWFAARQRPAAE
jgi:hypothetical protein